MDPIALFTASDGRLGRKPFWLALAVVYLASFASHWLLTGTVTARSGVWPFAFVQAGILWAWTVVHIKRLRDAGRPAAGAIGVGVLYALSLGLILLLVALFLTDTPGADVWIVPQTVWLDPPAITSRTSPGTSLKASSSTSGAFSGTSRPTAST